MKYYLLGIKGAGVSTLACILHDLGNEVIGYDDVRDYRFTEEELNKRGISIYYDSSLEVDENTTVIHSAAFKPDHKEISRLKETKAIFKDYQQMLGDLTRMFRTISVAGTHGKTTTTSMISQLFNKITNKTCNYFIGDGHGHASKDNEYFIIESCEFNKHFLNYNPTISIITNIEIEHMEVFKDLDDIIDTYNKFVDNTKDKVIVCGNSEYTWKLNNDHKKLIYYGTVENCDLRASNIKYHEQGMSFDVYFHNDFYDHFELPFYGEHMLLNSLAVICLCLLEKIDKECIKSYLGLYNKATRRFNEEIINDTIIVDDYAHHPSEIKATLMAAKQKYPTKKIVAVFRPNTYSRTKLLYKDFASVLSTADYAYITDIYCDREKQSDNPGITSNLIIDLCPNSQLISKETITLLLKHKSEVICFMSCKDINDLKNTYIDLIK